MYFVDLEEEVEEDELKVKTNFREELLSQNAWLVNVEAEILKLKQSIR